jgi:acetolactate synthase-1/2/3 large subunit
MTDLTVAQCIARALQRHGVDVIFGQSLPSAVILACEAIGIRQLAYRQENMGGAMADPQFLGGLNSCLGQDNIVL